MRRILYMTVVLLIGCQGVSGPRDRRTDPVRIDNPALSIAQQKQLGRDRLALPEASRSLEPRGSADLLGRINP